MTTRTSRYNVAGATAIAIVRRCRLLRTAFMATLNSAAPGGASVSDRMLLRETADDGMRVPGARAALSRRRGDLASTAESSLGVLHCLCRICDIGVGLCRELACLVGGAFGLTEPLARTCELGPRVFQLFGAA